MATANNQNDLSPDALAALNAKRKAAFNQVFEVLFPRGYDNPVVYLDDAVLESPPVITFYKRQFGYISKVMTYEYTYRSWKGFDQDLLDRYSEIIAKKLSSIQVLLENNCNRLQKLIQQNGVQLTGSMYSNPLVTTVPVICSPARDYFNVLLKLDLLHKLAGAANLYGVITSTQRAQAEVLCKKAVRAFEALLRNEVVRIYREADRLNEVARKSGQVNETQSAQVEEHKGDLAKLDNSMAQDAASDRALDLGGLDPSALIDNAVAVSTAGAKSGSRKKATETPAPQESTSN